MSQQIKQWDDDAMHNEGNIEDLLKSEVEETLPGCSWFADVYEYTGVSRLNINYNSSSCERFHPHLTILMMPQPLNISRMPPSGYTRAHKNGGHARIKSVDAENIERSLGATAQ